MRAELGVSRSSLREGFQLLIQERLMVHRLSRGFFVRELSRSDISDLYQVRTVLECGALRQVTALSPQGLRRLAQATASGQDAVGQGDWLKAAAASIGFHEALVALADSPRLSGLARQVLAEFRLSYAYMSDPFSFHSPFAERNEEIADLVRSGDLDGGERALWSYLQDSEEALLAQFPEKMGRTN